MDTGGREGFRYIAHIPWSTARHRQVYASEQLAAAVYTRVDSESNIGWYFA